MRKELNEQDLTQVAGGNYCYDKTAGVIYFGQKGSPIRKFTVNSGVDPDTVSALLIGAYKESNTSDENDNDMINALNGYITEVL